jgi:hypothetical protein
MRDHSMAVATLTLELPSSGIEIDVVVEYEYRPGCEAQTYGPAENCYPAEAAEVDIIAAHGAETGTDVLPLLRRETIVRQVLRYLPPVPVALIENVVEDLLERGDPDADHRWYGWRQAA